MSVKIARLWKNAEFNALQQPTRLLYIYLATNPDLNTVGVFSPNLEVVRLEVGLEEDVFQDSCRELVKSRLVYAKNYNNVLYFVVPAHFNTIPKSESSIARVQKTLSELPKELVDFLATKNITVNAKVKIFNEPTPQEVIDYALLSGHRIDGEEFCKFYREQAERYGKKNIWVDSNGKQVRDWKAKLRKVWFKDENKLKIPKGCPKGFEDLFVKVEGMTFVPDGWRNGKPFSKTFTADLALKKKYEKLTKRS